MKILDKLFLRQFLPLFILTLFIAQFILLMQFLWKYIDDLIGKGLEWYIISELMFYASAYTVPLSIPIAVLLSSLMTLGSLGEHNELLALKSSGISMLRGMRSLYVLVLFISLGAFLFSNYYLPYANLKFGTLLYDIRQKRPALNIRPGSFYNEIDGYSIKLRKKDADHKTVHDIIIYDHTSGHGNDNILMADKGEMYMSEDKQFLILRLFDGHQYQEVAEKKKSKRKYEHLRVTFKEWEKIFDLSELSLNRTDESLFKDHYEMLNVRQLRLAADSIKESIELRNDALTQHIQTYFYFKRDSIDSFIAASGSSLTSVDFISTFNEDDRANIIRRANKLARTTKQFISFAKADIDVKKGQLILHEVEYHQKFTWALACIVLFLIGGPLGAIIRKGGLGWPLVVAIILFINYYIVAIIGESNANQSDLTPAQGAWINVVIFLPIGIFLTYKVNNDSVIFNKEGLIIRLKEIFSFKYLKRSN